MLLIDFTNLWLLLGILFCLTQSAMFSGLNLALFSISRLRLEAEAEQGRDSARQILALRKDANLLLCTILWGNVSVNVLLALLSDSVFAGVAGFVFSTVGITFFGEIIPQAYFSRNALRIGAALTPVIQFYRVLFWPVAKPCSFVLDTWIGPEGPSFFRERELEVLLEKHIREDDSEIGATEGRGALNFLALDDQKISQEGKAIKEDTVIALPTRLDLPVIPNLASEDGQAILTKLKQEPRKRHIFTSLQGVPLLVLDSAEFLACYYSSKNGIDIYRFCHRPIVVFEEEVRIDDVLSDFVITGSDAPEGLINHDVVLYWTDEEKRIITSSDIFRNLLLGIAQRPEEFQSGAEARQAGL